MVVTLFGRFILLVQAMHNLSLLMQHFIEVMDEIGMPIAHNKTLGPAPVIEFLGFLLNFFKQTIGIPEKSTASFTCINRRKE